MNFPDSELWTFSEQTYALPEVEDICLKLQNNFEADINIIFYCIWIAKKSITLNSDDACLLIKTAEPWQKNILKPLRDARKMMKQHIIAMPSNMLDQTVSNLGEMELNAEHMTQLALEKIINIEQCTNKSELSPIECASTNLSNYLHQLETITSIDQITEELSTLLNAVFQDPEAIQVALMSEA
jgi:uncharacterized protein (TIGR02444 family)